jgi:pimeloyl-ACP methyl ester carboxylesterase
LTHDRPSFLTVLVVAVPAFFAAGCLAPFRSATPAPLPSIEVSKAVAESACTALLLPGTWDYPRDFARHDFGALAREAGAPLDLIAVDAHVGYYKNRSVVTRLHEDFVAPLRARGERVWLVGVSLGGVGSLIYAAEREAEIEGMVLFAPFLGDREVLDEIRAAGGPLAWRAPAEIGQDDWQRRVWKYLQEWHARKGPKPAIYVAYGRYDNFADGIRLLAGLLPPENIRQLPGGHDWKTWKSLWQGYLAAGIFDRCGAAEAPSR